MSASIRKRNGTGNVEIPRENLTGIITVEDQISNSKAHPSPRRNHTYSVRRLFSPLNMIRFVGVLIGSGLTCTSFWMVNYHMTELHASSETSMSFLLRSRNTYDRKYKRKKNYPEMVRVRSYQPTVYCLTSSGDCDIKLYKRSRKLEGVDGLVMHRNNEYSTYKDPFVDKSECIPMNSWQEIFYPTCNSFHEIYFATDSVNIIGQGGWRNAWKVNHGIDEEIILKALRWKTPIDKYTFKRHQIDAIISEHLTSSPYTIDIFGFCGESTMNEVGNGSFDDLVLSSTTVSETLKYAFQVATGIAHINDLEGNGNATIVHNDIKPGNIILVDGIPKINDFNDGELLGWNRTSHRQCYFRRYTLQEWVRYRAPEQTDHESHLTVAVDSYALGNILFHLLTKKKPYFELKAMSRAKDLTMNGIPPKIPALIRKSNDTRISTFVGVIDQLQYSDPVKRLSSWVAAEKLGEIMESGKETLQNNKHLLL